MGSVHPTAIVEAGAKLADSVRIGPYCVVGAEVDQAENVTLRSHVVVGGRTRIGAGTEVFPFASVGLAPQDLKYRGEPSRLEIGRNNRIREHVTINPGTEGGGMLTRIGDDNLLMVGVHVAHDCLIGDHCVLVNNGTLGGHVVVEDFAVLGGLSAVHQFVRIGRHAMIGGMSAVKQDVIPFGTVTGNLARLQGLNLVGMKRRGFDRATIHALRAAYRLVFESTHDTMADRIRQTAEKWPDIAAVREMVAFLRADSTRKFCMPPNGDDDDA